MTREKERASLPPHAVRVSPRTRGVSLRITVSKGLEVVLPRGMDYGAVPELLHRHRAWIERQLARLAKEEPKRVGGGLPTELELRALGERWRLEYQPYAAKRQQVIERAGRSLALNCEAWDTASASALLAPWLREKARSYLIPRLAQLSKETGLEYRCVQIKWQRTLWGSCSSKRRINLSAKLIFLPSQLVRYVLVHELCHTKHCNHSARFWRLVAVFEPAYPERKGALRQMRSLVPGFLEG